MPDEQKYDSSDSDAKETSSVTSDITYVENDLLTYIQFYMNRSTNDNIKRVICRFYSPEAIAEAKSVLWDNAIVSAVMGRKPTRQKSVSRDVHEADVSDILTAMFKMDKQECFPVKFVHWELDNVPKYSPEETDEGITAARISQSEQRLRAVEDRADQQAESIRTLQMLVEELLQTKNDNQTKLTPSFAEVVTQQAENGAKSQQRNRGGNPIKPALSGSKAMPKQRSATSGLRVEIPLNHDKLVLPSAERTENNIRTPTSETGGFKFQYQERRKQRRAAIVGKRKDSNIRSGAKYVYMFVSRVHHDVPESELKSFIEDNGVDVCEISRVSHEEARMKSFKIKTVSSNKEILLRDTFWPEGIMCREFYGGWRNKEPE